MHRRALLRGLGAALAMPLVLPIGRRAQAFAGSSTHRFLFIHCTGGWDHLMVFTPVFSPDVVSRSSQEQSAVMGAAGNLPFVDHPSRATVAQFFAANAHRTALVHGIEARSVAHDVCLRLMLTGSSQPGQPDWGTRIAAPANVMLPMLVMSGPSYSGDLGRAVVRLGQDGQLVDLLDGTWQAKAQPATTLPADSVQALEDAFALERAQAFQASAPAGRAQGTAQDAVASESRVGALAGLGPQALGADMDLVQSTSAAFDLFAQDRAACAAVEFLGNGDLGFDTHAANDNQSAHFGSLFLALSQILQDLDTRTDAGGAPLADSTTLVITSEMGRHPRLNSRGGREHWTFTPAMLVGGGFRGDQSVGAYDTSFRGEPVDLATGRPDPNGSPLLPGHLGATLLAMAGQDPTPVGLPPIQTLLT